jgi:hypothetical protein
MTSMEWPQIQVAADGRVRVRDGFRTLYFISASHSALVGQVAAALDYYIDLVGSNNLRVFVDDEGETADFTTTQIPALLNARFSGDYETEGAISILSTDIGVPDSRFYYYGTKLPDVLNPGLRNYLDLWFPTSLVQKVGVDHITRAFIELGSLFPVSSAYASPALFYNQEVGEAAQRTIRFPGFDIVDPAAACLDIDNLVPGVYWLLLLGPDLTASLGGLEVLQPKLPSSVIALPAGKSLCLRLGAAPVVGDVNRPDRETDLYRAVARILEPVLHVPQVTYILDESGAPDRAALIRWYRRFLE